MAKLLISNTTSLPLSPPSSSSRASFNPPHVPPARLFLSGKSSNRGVTTVVTRAGPTTSQYVFAFVLPLSLIAFTVFTSIRIADKLDRDYLEEVAINQAIRETDEDDEVDMSLEEKAAVPRTRNRPKREV
ncbi:hypothetical protein RchiOBHm_Chr1g0319401 [Rosa chinensis]|uniref:High chlorophyll fluorescence 153 n=1 Tax=Rosa chinensis TaxID=74649 RepID=A0A2P6S8I2_ROSCH|nr:uncharacterized protein LOC112196804 [Rosa chinensis]PRQ54964.1 hypothetical protein RchiOBHm_Chr1g0319401 [Rosa chinensis]